MIVTRSTELRADSSLVWERVVSEEGINDELGPILRMTMPVGLKGATVDTVDVGVPLGRSWILLFGIIPVDYDDLQLAEVEPGRRFLEDSTMGSMKRWQHERVVEPIGEGCRVTDTLTLELRGGLSGLPGAERIVASIVGRLFKHRHRRLARHFA